MALVVPAGDYDKESRHSQTSSSSTTRSTPRWGFPTSKRMDGYMLTDRLTPRQFSELTDLDYEVAEFLYAAYAANHAELWQDRRRPVHLHRPAHRYVPLSLRSRCSRAIVTLERRADTACCRMPRSQMNERQGSSSKARALRAACSSTLTLPESGDETYAFTDKIHRNRREVLPR